MGLVCCHVGRLIGLCCPTVPNSRPRSYFGPISLLLTHTSLYIHSNHLHSNTLLANRFQVLVARPRDWKEKRNECVFVQKLSFMLTISNRSVINLD
jgi:hypothetical protein